MAERTVEWISECKLVCVGVEDAPVVLCIDPVELITVDDCGYQPRTIDGTLTGYCCYKDACGKKFWKYVITYEDEDLIEDTILIADNITNVFCKNCLTTWVEDKVGNEVTMVENEDGSITFTSQHGCEFTFWPGVEPESEVI